MAHPLKQLQVRGSHREVGQAIGQQCATEIHAALDNYPFFQQELLPFHRTAEGQQRFDQFLTLNRERYPTYITELEGLAQGAQRPFEELLLLNLRGEYRDFFHDFHPHGCCDCAIVTDQVALIGHNEDAAPEFAGHMYLVQATIDDKPMITALSYPGFVWGNAFGFNAQGICFSVDNVRPLQGPPGLARHFVARSLLDATTIDEAIERATVAGQASGFHYTIGSVRERRVVSVETSPTAHAVKTITDSFFHANHYVTLDVPQLADASSAARLQHGQALLKSDAPTSDAGLLALLHDRQHPTYPLYGTADTLNPLMTHYTALFDLDHNRIRIYPHSLNQAIGTPLELSLTPRA